MTGPKTCTKCGSVKPGTPEYFVRSGPTGLHGWCKDCTKKLGKAIGKRRKESRGTGFNPYTGQNKICCGCQKAYPVSKDTFGINLSNPDGLSQYCRQCRRDRQAAYRKRKPLYVVWRGMVDRCENENTDHFDRYGGRGIYVAEPWRSTPETFYSWLVENDWRPGREIDRINNDGPYSPDNCRLVSRAENTRNTSRTVLNIELVKQIKTIRRQSPEYGAKKIAEIIGKPDAVKAIYNVIYGRSWKEV